MTTVLTPRAEQRVERLHEIWEERPGLVGWLTTVDHKRIGLLYLFTTMAFFLAGGVEALLMRTQLAQPNEHVVSPERFNELFTTHGVTMIFFAVIPMQIGAFGNYLVPLMIGARDMAFPRMNALSYWLFLASGVFLYAGVFSGHAPNAGWFDYVPLALKRYNPGSNVDFYALALIFTGVSTTLGAINLIVTIFKNRAPGMSLNRMPLFCFAILATSFSLIFALPSLTVDLVFLELQRKAGFHFFDVGHGGDPLLWQHLFWIFGHPEVYIIVLPAFGIATSIIPTFSRRKMLAFPLVALAELLVAFIGFGVWAHHMFATGLPLIAVVFFAAASMMVVIPSTIQVFAWTLTVTMGRPLFNAPLMFIGGFIVFFVLGGLSGISFAAIPIDQATTDTYYVVAHFHFIIFGAAVFPLLGGLFYWFPKVTGRLYNEPLAQAGFWLTFVGTALTFFPMHIAGWLGMTRRVYTYPSDAGWSTYNLIESVGGFVLAAGLVADRVQPRLEPRQGAAVRTRSFLRRHARVDDGLAAAALQLRRHPARVEPVPELGPGRPRGGRARPRPRRSRLRRRARDAGVDGQGRLPRRRARDAFGVGVADRDRRLRIAALRARAAVALSRRALVRRRRGARARRMALARAGAGAAVTEAVVPARPRTASSNGWWGMVAFVATEATLFGVLLGTYFYLRVRAVHWPPPGTPAPKVVLPLVLAGVLAATTIPIFLASRAASAGLARRTQAFFFVALVVQSVYFGIQIHEMASDLDRFTPQQSSYGSIYYTLLGAAHTHVAVGILMSMWLVLRLVTGLTRYRLAAVRAIAFYWYAVAVIGVVVALCLATAAL